MTVVAIETKGFLATKKYEAAFRGRAAFPVPADEVLFIPLMEVAEARTVQLRDAQGRLVKEQRVPMASALVGVDVSDLAPGVYTYGYAGGAARRAVVR